MFIAKSLIFYPRFLEYNCQELSDEIVLPAYYLNTLIEQFDDKEILYVNIINTITKQMYLTTINSPHNYDKNTVFVPQWILDIIGCIDDNSSIIKIQKVNMDDIPIATKITIKPLDPIAFTLNTLSCFEKTLMNIHSIQEGITIPVHISLVTDPLISNQEHNSNYTMFAHIEKVEPSKVSRIICGEVNVEFINDFIESASTENASTENASIESASIESAQNSIIIPESSSTETISAEERRKQVRDSWIKRFQNNGVLPLP